MAEEPKEIIDSYLALVSDHLDDSISEEIISELRSVMIATADDMSGGEMTVQSAKKVVARFGAPSEVADEYTFSMFPERAELLEAAEPRSRDERTTERVPVSYSQTLWKAVKLSILVSVPIWFSSFIFSPPWAFPSILIPIIQILVVTTAFGMVLRRSQSKGLELHDRTYPEWDVLQRSVTFPENVAIQFGSTLRNLDILLSVIAFLLFSFTLIIPSPPGPFFILSQPLLVLFGLRVILGFQRLGKRDPATYARHEVLLDVPILLLLDMITLWSFLTGWGMDTVPVSTFSTFAFFISLYILFQMVINIQDLWVVSDYSLKDETSPTVDLDVVLSRARSASRSLLYRVSQFYISAAAIGIAVLILASGLIPFEFIFARSIGVLFIVLFSLACSLSISLIYIGIKHYALKKGYQKAFVKHRHRGEALVDFIVSTAILIILIPNIPFMIRFLDGLALDFIYHSPLVYFTIMISASASILFAFLSIFSRILSTIGDVLMPGSNVGPQAMWAAGTLFILSMGTLAGLILIALDYFGSSIGVLIGELAVSTIIAVQGANASLLLEDKSDPPVQPIPSMSN